MLVRIPQDLRESAAGFAAALLVGPNVKVNRHFAACRVWARILAQTWHAVKCPVERVVRPRLEHSLTIYSKNLKCSDGEKSRNYPSKRRKCKMYCYVCHKMCEESRAGYKHAFGGA